MDVSIDYKQGKKAFSRVSLSLFLLLVISFVAQIIIVVVASFFDLDLFSNTWLYYISMLLPIYVIAFPLFLLITRRFESVNIEKTSLSLKQILFFTVLVFPLMYIGNIIGLLVGLSLQFIFNFPAPHALEETIRQDNLLANFVFIVVLAPIVEEIVFRKILIDRLIKHGKVLSIIISGLFFGLFHGNFFQFFYATTLGMLFAFIYVISGRVRYAIALHMFVNFLGSIVGTYLGTVVLEHLETFESSETLENALYMMTSTISLFAYLAILLSLVITGTILFILQRKRFRIKEIESAIPRGKRFSTSILNVGSIIFLLACIAQFVVWVLL